MAKQLLRRRTGASQRMSRARIWRNEPNLDLPQSHLPIQPAAHRRISLLVDEPGSLTLDVAAAREKVCAFNGEA
jgi:hypothetical protein